MKRDDVAYPHDLVKGCVELPHPAHALVGREQDAHAEGTPKVCDRPAKSTITDDPERRASKVPDRKIEEAELPGFLPPAPDHRIAVSSDAPPQGEDEGEGMLRDRVDRVIANVRDSDAA